MFSLYILFLPSFFIFCLRILCFAFAVPLTRAVRWVFIVIVHIAHGTNTQQHNAHVWEPMRLFLSIWIKQHLRERPEPFIIIIIFLFIKISTYIYISLSLFLSLSFPCCHYKIYGYLTDFYQTLIIFEKFLTRFFFLCFFFCLFRFLIGTNNFSISLNVEMTFYKGNCAQQLIYKQKNTTPKIKPNRTFALWFYTKIVNEITNFLEIQLCVQRANIWNWLLSTEKECMRRRLRSERLRTVWWYIKVALSSFSPSLLHILTHVIEWVLLKGLPFGWFGCFPKCSKLYF